MSAKDRADEVPSYRAHKATEYDVDVERNFRAFVKSLDVDDRVIMLHFKGIVDVSDLGWFGQRTYLLTHWQKQRDLDARAAQKEERTSRARWQHRLYPHHDESNIRANRVGINRAEVPTRRDLQRHSNMGLVGSDSDDGSLTYPPGAELRHGIDMANDRLDVWYPGEDLEEWDDFAEVFVGGYDGYDDVPLDFDADFDAGPRRGRQPLSLGPDRREQMAGPSGNDSPPWSLSRERRRARNSDLDAARPGPRPSEPTYDSLPLFLPVGDTPLPASDDSASDVVHLDDINNHEALYPQEEFVSRTEGANMDDWLQQARTEIDEENAFFRSDVTSPRDDVPVGASDIPGLILSGPSDPSVPPVRPQLTPSTRRRRVHLEDTGVPDEADRNVRRRTAAGPISNIPSDLGRPPFLPRHRPSVPFPVTALGGARMQRTRHSMPPSAAIAGRDTRRDGIVVDYADLPSHFLEAARDEARGSLARP